MMFYVGVCTGMCVCVSVQKHVCSCSLKCYEYNLDNIMALKGFSQNCKRSEHPPEMLLLLPMFQLLLLLPPLALFFAVRANVGATILFAVFWNRCRFYGNGIQNVLLMKLFVFCVASVAPLTPTTRARLQPWLQWVGIVGGRRFKIVSGSLCHYIIQLLDWRWALYWCYCCCFQVHAFPLWVFCFLWSLSNEWISVHYNFG